MAREKKLQTNMSAGEIAPDIRMRQDTDQYQNGAKVLTNRRCLISGGTKRRPGDWYEYEFSSERRLEPFVVDQTNRYVLAFSAGAVDVFRQNNTTRHLEFVVTLGGCPWTGTIWRDMDYTQSGSRAWFAHHSMPPDILTRAISGSWSRTPLTYNVGPGNIIEQPYFKVAPAGMTLQPSGLTGSVTLLTSAPWFDPSHVGSRIRYFGRELLMTGFVSTQVMVASVFARLPDSLNVSVGDLSRFLPGEFVAGSSTGAHGIIAAIGGGFMQIVLVDKLILFTTADTLIGPNAVTNITGVSTSATPAAVTDWDEQLFSTTWGYPSCATLHRNRLLFGGHAKVPNALIGSAISLTNSFDVGDGSDADGIFETIGDEGASSIVQMHSAEQLIILTDRGPYYVPEGASNPFRPSSIAFYPFGSPWPITPTAKAQAFDDGVLFISGSLIIKARPTGDVNRSWLADEVSLLSSHLVKSPTRLAVTSNFAAGPERYAMILNNDGTLAVLQLVEAQKIRNMTAWTTSGKYSSLAALGGDVYAATERVVGSGISRFFLEFFDQSITLDLATQYATVGDLSGITARYLSAEVHVTATETLYLGTYPLAIANPPAGPFVAGLYYDSTIETLAPIVESREGSKAGELMRILEAYITVHDSGRFAANGQVVSGYQVTDQVDMPPPALDGPIRKQFLGWTKTPTIVINQPDPLRLDVLAIKQTVAIGR